MAAHIQGISCPAILAERTATLHPFVKFSTMSRHSRFFSILYSAITPFLKKTGLATICGLCLLVSSAGAETSVFIATNGSDANPGTLEKPFASVRRAQEEIRRLRSEKPNETLGIVFRGGIYYLEEPIRLTPEDGGSESGPVVYRPHAGEQVILSGGRAIGTFKQTAPNRWETTIPEVAAGDWYFSQLYVNSRRAKRTLLPRNGYYTVAKPMTPTTGTNPDRFVYGDAPFDPNWKNLGDVEINTFHKWTMDHLRMRSVDPAKKIVTFTGPTHSYDQASLDQTTYYRIENVYEELKEPGDWYLDRKTGVLTVLVKPGFDLNRATVIAPKLERLVSLDGDYKEKKQVANVTFKNLTFAHTGWTTPEKGAGFPQADVNLDGTVTMTAARKITLDTCIVRHTGCYGIDVSDGSSDINLVRCELFDLGAGGIKIGPSRLGGDDTLKYVTDVKVTDCLIAHGGRVHAEGVGVWIGHANHCTVEHNAIYDFYYSGVSVGWKWGWGESPAHHNRIAWNHIHTIGQGVLNDMAGIYTLGESPGTVLVGNRIHDVRRTNYGGWGIYFDQASRFILAEDNIVYRTQDGAFHQHWGKECTVRKNVFAFSENGLIAISNLQESGPLAFEENVFLMDKENLWEKDQLRDDTTFKHNLYWRLDGKEPRFFGSRTLEQWKTDKEPDAVVVSPGFVNPKGDDFTLAGNSPAVMLLGFRPDDKRKAGRLTPQNLTANLGTPDRVFPPGIPAENILRNQIIDEDFETYEPGDRYLDMTAETFKESICLVTDAASANDGKRSLIFKKGTDSKFPWQPHLHKYIHYDSGTIHASFDLRVEESARVAWEMRDWRRDKFGGGYKTGPQITVGPDGKLTSHGKEIAKLPFGRWVTVDVVFRTEEGKSGTFTLTVTVPGEEPKRQAISVQPGFEMATWYGFSSHGDPGTVFYVDNIKLRRESP